MTTVHIDLQRATPTGDVSLVGTLEFQPTRRYGQSGAVVLPLPFRVIMDGAPKDIVLDQNDSTWCWKVIERFNKSTDVMYLTVPNSGSVVNYSALLEVDPKTFEPSAEPAPSWLVAINAIKNETAAFRFRDAQGIWEPRPVGYRTVVSVGTDPSPDDQQPGDVRMTQA